MAVVRELITKFAFNADTNKVKEFDKGLASVAKQAAIVAAAVTAAATAAFAFANSAAKAGDEIAKTARKIGFGTKELQQYRFALGQLGISQGIVDASLSAFTRRIGEFAAKGAGPAAATIEQFNIQVLDLNGNIRETEDVFRDVLGILSTINSEAERTAFADALFSQSGRAFSLASDIQEINRLVARFDELNIAITDVETLVSERFLDSMDELRRIFAAVKNEIGFNLLPIVEETTNAFKEWFIANRELISQGLKSFLQPIVSLFDSLKFIVVETAKAIGELHASTKIFLGIFAGIGAILLAPWLAWVGIIALALLILDDIVNFFKGNDSVIGQVIEGWRLILEQIVRLLNKIPGINIRTRSDESSVDDLLTPGASARIAQIGLPPVRNFASDITGQAIASSNRSISVESTVNVSVPDGTSQEVQQAAREQARLGAIEGFEQVLRQTQNEFPITE